jgi:hypothetical protein
MNIFYLHPEPKQCAEMHIDKHVVKMIIEYAQLLSTAHRILDGEEYTELTANGRRIKRWTLNDSRESILYKASHINHPSAKWARVCSSHYTWLYNLFCALCDEYTHRYGRVHMTDQKLRIALAQIPKNIGKSVIFEEPTPAMPDECKIANDSLASYHKYYVEKKIGFAKWTKRERPKWFTEGILQKLVEENERLGLYEDANIHI